MSNFIQQILDILVSPPGNLVYHLILAFAVAASLQAALSYRGRSPVPARRVVVGLVIILTAQLVLFSGSGLAWQGLADPQRLLPPLDRTVVAFTLLWVAWLWCFPKPDRVADALVGLLSLAIITLGLFTVISWLTQSSDIAFNASIYDWGWTLVSLGLAFIAILLLLLVRPTAWETGFAMLGLMLAGFMAHSLLVTAEGSFSGAIRLAQLCAYSLLPVVANRLNAAEPTRRKVSPSPPTRDDEPYPRTRLAWMRVAAETGGQPLYNALAQALAQTMRADLCLLMAAPGAGQNWILRGGSDLVSDQSLAVITIHSPSIPIIANALQHGQSIVLPASGGLSPDLSTIGKALCLEDAGTLLAVPLLAGGNVWGGIFLLCPYTLRTWSEAEINALQAETTTLAQIVLRGESTYVPEGSDHDQEQVVPLHTENHALIERSRHEPLHQPLPSELEQTQGELRITLEEIAYLQNELAKADVRIKELERVQSSPHSLSPQNNDLLVTITQELRQPVSSMTGYCDLLLSGSAGPVSDTQRSFLEQVRATVERMRVMMDDLVHVAGRGGASISRPVELNELVDQAVTGNSALLRQKNLALRVDLPEQIPALHANPGVLRPNYC